MRSHRALLFAAAACVAVVVATILLRGQPAGDAAPLAEVSQQPSDVAGSLFETAPVAPTSNVQASGTPDLPPRFALLRERADTGDAKAACQLATELMRCAGLPLVATPDHLASLRKQEAEHAANGRTESANMAAAAQLFALELQQACEGLPASATSLAPAYLRRAALAGEPEAMLRYAQGDGLVDLERGLRFIREPLFDQWRSEAPRMLESLLEAGQPAAVLVLLDAYNADSTLGMITPPDRERTIALHALARRVFEQHGDLPEIRLDPALTREEHRVASRQAKAWHEAYFAGRTYRLSEQAQAIAPLLPPLQQDGRRAPADRVACGETGGEMP